MNGSNPSIRSMKIVHVKDKFVEYGVSVDDIVLGDFDQIGRFTAERTRNQDDENYKKYGWAYRSNYERGVFLYHLVQRFRLTSMLEIGFGRGYSTFCVAKSFHDFGLSGKILSIDPNIDEKFTSAIQKIMPQDWFSYINLVRGTSQEVIQQLPQSETFDIAYIDGDHSIDATRRDWDLVKDRATKFVLFDDYHMPGKEDAGIACRQVIDLIDWEGEGFYEPELIKMDRRLFQDDRGFTDDQINYGQVLFTRKDVKLIDDTW